MNKFIMIKICLTLGLLMASAHNHHDHDHHGHDHHGHDHHHDHHHDHDHGHIKKTTHKPEVKKE